MTGLRFASAVPPKTTVGSKGIFDPQETLLSLKSSHMVDVARVRTGGHRCDGCRQIYPVAVDVDTAISKRNSLSAINGGLWVLPYR